jgi:hypothetical protein
MAISFDSIAIACEYHNGEPPIKKMHEQVIAHAGTTEIVINNYKYLI